jgi:hypothetical protein
MKIIARDELGHEFAKTVEIIDNENGTIVSLGFPCQWYFKDIKHEPRDGSDKMYIDAGGRNHRGSPVYVSHSELMSIVKKLTCPCTSCQAEEEPTYQSPTESIQEAKYTLEDIEEEEMSEDEFYKRLERMLVYGSNVNAEELFGKPTDEEPQVIMLCQLPCGSGVMVLQKQAYDAKLRQLASNNIMEEFIKGITVSPNVVHAIDAEILTDFDELLNKLGIKFFK